ncbi:MAG: hypothetical protein NTV63_01935 [Candidatus Woesearchaeota archaeon]|nr:hypothetical protein [Candidatus Woesearchaeota archaeon]
MKTKLLLSVIFFSLALILPLSSSAQIIENSSYTFRIEKNRVLVTGVFELNENTMIDVLVDLPDDATDTSLILDEIPRRITYTDEKGKKLRIRNIGQEIQLSYSTKNLIKNSAFFVTIKPFYETRVMDVEAVLPEGYSLETPIKDENFETASIYPIPDEVKSDGQTLVFKWRLNNVNVTDAFSMMLLLKKKFPYAILIISSLSVLVIALSLYFYAKRKKQPSIIIKTVEKIEQHLKEDEEQLVNIMKQRGGSCEQGTLKVIMGLPKSSLSRLIKELEERKIVFKQKKGKKNLISFKK